MISNIAKRIELNSLESLSMVDLVTYNRQLMLIAEFYYLLHMGKGEYCAHWIGGIDYEEELGFRSDQGSKIL